MEEKTCSNCAFDDLHSHEEPCCKCRNTAPISEEYTKRPFLWVSVENVRAASNDAVNHPAHYTGKVECIEAMIECFGAEYVKGFCLCNAFKYLWRCKSKHETPVEDVKKAMWYIEKYLEMEGVKND